MKIVLKPNEMIIRAGNTNLCQDNRKIQGKLIVTNQRIYFRTIEEEEQCCNKEINPSEILDMIFFNTYWLLPNGINIVTKGGMQYAFLVSNRNEWAKLITRMY